MKIQESKILINSLSDSRTLHIIVLVLFKNQLANALIDMDIVILAIKYIIPFA